jgi:glycerophosphoryl diester phosphodiesterase
LPAFQTGALPLVIAHRGSSAYAPENTIASFELAVRQGADAIELDAMLCAGGEIVVIHDSTLERTTGHPGRVADLTLADLRSLDAGAWFDPSFAGARIPTLDEVLETVGRELLTNIEIKNYSTPFDNLAEKIALCVSRHNLKDRVIFSSFNPLNFRAIKRHMPEAPVGYLTEKGFARPWLERALRWAFPFDTLHPHFSDASPQYIKRAHHARTPVLVYTVNEAQSMQALFQAGVDGIITDDPPLALDTRSQHPFVD